MFVPDYISDSEDDKLLISRPNVEKIEGNKCFSTFSMCPILHPTRKKNGVQDSQAQILRDYYWCNTAKFNDGVDFNANRN